MQKCADENIQAGVPLCMEVTVVFLDLSAPVRAGIEAMRTEASHLW